MPTNTAAWLLDNIGRATRWRDNTPYGDGCPHDCEGGVDIPLPVGTPIYAIATGKLIGNCWSCWHGHGVITQQVPGIGKLYYQHLDVTHNIPECSNGSGCQGYIVHAGQFIGYSTNVGGGEIEVGINPAWGGIWGPPNNGANWVGDPRAMLKRLALSGGTTGGGTVPAIDPKTCKDCILTGIAVCPDGQFCALTVGAQPGHGCCQPSQSAGDVVNSILGSVLPGWLVKPDWFRVLKFVLGVLGILVGVAALFLPEAEKQLAKVAEVGAMA